MTRAEDFAGHYAADMAEVVGAGEFSQTATFTPKGGAAVPNVPVVIEEREGRRLMEYGEQDTRSARLMVQKTYVAAVGYGDQFEVGGVVWQVQMPLSEDTATVECEVTTNTLIRDTSERQASRGR